MEFKEPLDEKDFNVDQNNSKENNNKRNLKIIIITISILLLIGIIIAIIFLFSYNKEDKNQNQDDKKQDEKQDDKKQDDIESIKIRLKNWEFGSSEEINLSGENITSGITSDKFHKAPEDFYVCTPMGGLSGHKDYFFYEKELKKVDTAQFDTEWWFKSKFNLENIDIKNNIILLHINGINYKSDVYLDGKLIETKENIIGTFVKYTLDITSLLNTETNEHYLAFKIKRPYNQWDGEKIKKDEIDLSTSFVDWNPESPDGNMGVWQPVDIEIMPYKIAQISSAFVNTRIINNNDSNLEIFFYIKNWENKNVSNNILIKIGDFINLKIENIVLEANEEKQISVNSNEYPQLKIDNSKLWWPYQMGEPKLHDLTIKVVNGNNYYIFKKKIGLRQIDSEINKTKDKRTYKINNKKILLKGAGWCPDLFLRQSPENYYDHINYVKDMELNVIRLEGNSEGEEFYDYCDKLGILIISGWCCCDAWQRWDDWGIENEKVGNRSVLTQIRKLSIHPSVIIFILGSDKPPSNGIEEKWREIFEKEKWPNEILSSAHHNNQDKEEEEKYPTGVKMSGPYSWVPPNYFYLEDARNKNYGGAWGFTTEGGPGENPLRKGSYEKIFNEENKNNYTSDSWNYHCGKEGGHFSDLDKFILPLNERYGNITDFDDFQKKSSAAVYEGHRAMFESFINYKYNSTGIIQWMLNNAWPSNIWHLYDYFFSPTPAYFATKKAGERIHILYNYEDYCIYLVNNYYDDFNSTIILNVYIISSLNGSEINEPRKYIFNSFKGDEIQKIDKLKNDYDNCYIIHFEYSYDYNGNNYYYTNTYWLNKEMDIVNLEHKTFYNVEITKYANLASLQKLPETSLKVTIVESKIIDDCKKIKNKYIFKITNDGEIIALLLEIKLYKIKMTELQLITPIFWNDNYFSIRNGTSYNVIAEFYNNNSNNDDLLLEIIGWNCKYNKTISISNK